MKNPKDGAQFLKSAVNAHREGDIKKAEELYLETLNIGFQHEVAYSNLGVIYKNAGRLEDSIKLYKRAIKSNPKFADAYSNLGNIFKEEGLDKDAVDCFKKAAEIQPSIQNLCRAKLYFPRIANSVREIKEQRENYLTNIRSIFEGSKTEEAEKDFVDLSLFMLTYQNGNDDRMLLEEIGKIVHPHLEVKPCREGNGQMEKKKLNTKKKIGFYFDNPQKEHAIFQHYYNLVCSFDKDIIEVILIKGPQAVSKNSKELEQKTSSTIQLPSNLKGSVESIRMLKLDVLVFTEIHSSPVPYCLAHNRMAKKQVVLPGNSITTGLDTIDYFMSSKYTEAIDSQNKYTEKLIKVDGIPTGIEFCSRNGDKEEICKKHNLQGYRSMLSLLHNPAKFHPDWDTILERIALECNNSIFLVQNLFDADTYSLSERWEKSAPTLLAKSKFIKRMNRDDYLCLTSCCDAVLDPLHRGCGTTAYDALAMRIPIITQPGLQSRSRLVSALYTIMEMNDAPIATSGEEYIELCYEIINNKKRAKAIKLEINEKLSRLAVSNKKTIDEIKTLLTRESI